jgi:hypothetical protein
MTIVLCIKHLPEYLYQKEAVFLLVSRDLWGIFTRTANVSSRPLERLVRQFFLNFY